jgi:hypothetical protein
MVKLRKDCVLNAHDVWELIFWIRSDAAIWIRDASLLTTMSKWLYGLKLRWWLGACYLISYALMCALFSKTTKAARDEVSS